MPMQWEVARPSHSCSACERGLEVGEQYLSALFDAGDTFERRDFCADCWQRETPEAFSFWKTRVPEPDEKPRLLVDDDVIVNFFLRLDGAEEEMKVKLRFIVMLILMRKRILKFDTTEREGDVEYWVLRMPRDKTRHRVVNPHLGEDEIGRLSEEVGDLLNMDV